jgi:hypothetical protein
VSVSVLRRCFRTGFGVGRAAVLFVTRFFSSFFVDVDLTDNKLAKKIREAQLEQYAAAAL